MTGRHSTFQRRLRRTQTTLLGAENVRTQRIQQRAGNTALPRSRYDTTIPWLDTHLALPWLSTSAKRTSPDVVAVASLPSQLQPIAQA